MLNGTDYQFPEFWRAFTSATGDSWLRALACYVLTLRPIAIPYLRAHFSCRDPSAYIHKRIFADPQPRLAASLLFSCARRSEFDLLIQVIDAHRGGIDLFKLASVFCDMVIAHQQFPCAVLEKGFSLFGESHRTFCDRMAWELLRGDDPDVCGTAFRFLTAVRNKLSSKHCHIIVEAVCGNCLPVTALDVIERWEADPADRFWLRVSKRRPLKGVVPREAALVKALC
jgi:hypothetical protein